MCYLLKFCVIYIKLIWIMVIKSISLIIVGVKWFVKWKVVKYV